jgi:hypothetical protein
MTQMDSMLPTWVLYLQAFSTPAIDSVSPHSSDEHLSPAGPENKRRATAPIRSSKASNARSSGCILKVNRNGPSNVIELDQGLGGFDSLSAKMGQLILKQASASRPSGEWNEHGFRRAGRWPHLQNHEKRCTFLPMHLRRPALPDFT